MRSVESSERTYSLIRFSPTSDTTQLYLRVEDPSENLVYTNLALGEMVERLPEDHARAARLAEAVAQRWPDCGLDPSSVRTNIVVFSHPDPGELLAYLGGQGVLAGTIAPHTVRLVTHHDVDDRGVDRAIRSLAGAPR